MPKAAHHRHCSTRSRTRPKSRVEWGWLSWLALAIGAAVIFARLTMLEVLRPALAAIPGAGPMPSGPGAATGLILDLLVCMVPVLLLARRCVDRSFSLRFSWSMAPMGMLGVWAVLSTLWADDKFAAAVSSCHLFAAFVLLWAAAQMVRSWLALRLIAGLCGGMLFVLLVHSAYFLCVERPELVRQWHEHSAEFLQQRGLEPGTFAAQQFEHKVLDGELMGFSTSSNTYAALIVLTLIVSAGVWMDRFSLPRATANALGQHEILPPGHQRRWPPIAVGLLVLLPALLMLALARSRGAFISLALAPALGFTFARYRHWIAFHAARVYWWIIGAMTLGAIALVGHGLYHGSLALRTLTFRWYYWVGAARMLRLHPLLGVGWDNFGPAYLAVRLPIAPEEVRDPHNFIVRFFAELGLVGGALLLLWMLRLWWELTVASAPLRTPLQPADAARRQRFSWRGSAGIMAILGCVIGGSLIAAAASIDFTQDAGYITIEVFRRFLFASAMLGGIAGTCLRRRVPIDASQSIELELDDRPMPWTLFALHLALGLFLLHNMIDFSLFETGPLCLFALLTGSALGLRLRDHPPARHGQMGAIICLAIIVVLSILATGAWVAPVVEAETLAASADDSIRSNHPVDGARALTAAWTAVPINGDYAARAAMAWAMAGDAPASRRMYDAAVARQPNSAGYHFGRAELELHLPQPDLHAAEMDFDTALRLDPANVGMRLEFANALATRLHQPEAARRQYELALSYNAQLPPGEPKRLSQAQIEQIHQQIRSLPHLP